MSEFRILLLDEVAPVLFEKLQKSGFIVDYKDGLEYDAVAAIIHDYKGIILRSKIQADKYLIDLGANLRFIGRVGAGMEIIDVAYAESKAIKCINSPEGNMDAVGEQSIGMLLSLLNNLNKADREVRNKIWDREGNRGYELNGKTIGIIGYGNMGKSFAKKLSGFDVDVIAYDKYKNNFSDSFVTEVELSEIYNKADIVSLHVPQTTETIKMIDDSFFKKCKKPIIIINTARGKVVDTESLVLAMKEGKVAGAALDVLEYESFNFQDFLEDEMPEPFNYLTHSDRVILTPHIAGWSFESKVKLASTLADKIISNFGTE